MEMYLLTVRILKAMWNVLGHSAVDLFVYVIICECHIQMCTGNAAAKH